MSSALAKPSVPSSAIIEKEGEGLPHHAHTGRRRGREVAQERGGGALQAAATNPPEARRRTFAHRALLDSSSG